MEKEQSSPGRRGDPYLKPLSISFSIVLAHDLLFHFGLPHVAVAGPLLDVLDLGFWATAAVGYVLTRPNQSDSQSEVTAAYDGDERRRDSPGERSTDIANTLLVAQVAHHERELAASQLALTRENEERTHAEERLRRISTLDPLTGLYKRSAFITQLEDLRGMTGAALAIFFVDIDHFKLINDGLGDMIADRVLIALSDRLSNLAPPASILGRVGGDEFALACEIIEPNQAATIGENILRAVAQPIAIDSQRIHASCSIGVRLSIERDERAATLLRDAHTAMHRSKQHGRARIIFFDSAMRDEVEHQYTLNSDLHQAVLREQIFVEYQPIHDLHEGHIIAYEALARWEHPNRGRIEPGVFIPAAEDNGLVAAIGAKVLRDACEQIVKHGITPATPIGINLSARQLAQPDLCETVMDTLAQYGIDPKTLLFEVTESTIVESLNLARGVLLRLKDLGFRIAIDDFGTGYSSLSYLRSLPFDVLKIDRAFVRHIDVEEHSRDIVRMIVTLAESLDLNVVAEGIETTAQMTTLRDLGCYRGQGFLFSRALPAAEAFRAPALTELVSRA